MSAWTCRSFDGKAAVKIVPPRPRIPWWKGLGADSEEKHEPASDIDTATADSLKVLDPKRPIREAEVAGACPDVFEDPEYTWTKSIELAQFRTMLGIPLLREGLAVGVIALLRSQAQ